MPTSTPEELSLYGRFDLVRRIGAGGFGIVYEAHDRKRGTRVALKQLRASRASSLLRFKQEFRALADLVHPNLVNLYELIAEGDQWFFTMELIEGGDILTWVRGDNRRVEVTETVHVPTPQDPTVSMGTPAILTSNVARLRDALGQLAEGVAALHRAGKIHRDLKHSNVLVTETGRVVILDFGLVDDIDPEARRRFVEVLGTPAYMAPEQFGGAPASAASDCYALGVMLFECLTGIHPSATSSGDMKPSSVVDGVPLDLDQLTSELLAREPNLRPSAAETAARMGSRLRAEIAAEPARGSTPFVGRKAELRELLDAFAAERAGRPVVALVHGGSGMGKSALIRQFLAELRDRYPDTVILAGRCFERESVPYKAVDTLVDALAQHLRQLPGEQVHPVVPLHVSSLARLFPVLNEVPAIAGSRGRGIEKGDSQEVRRRAFLAFRDFIARMAERSPLVLCIDDLQWGDLDSGALLAELLHPPDVPPVLFIGSYRTDEAWGSSILRVLEPVWRDAAGAVETREIELRELGSGEANELALALARDAGGDLDSLSAAIARESRGIPFFIGELTRYAEAGGGAALASVDLNEVIHDRLARIPQRSRRMLEVVAVANRPLSRELVWRAAGFDSDDPGAFGILRSARLIRGEEHMEPYHDRIRETVLSRLAPDILRSHHLNLGRGLEEAGYTDPETLAIHFHGGGDLARAARYAATAAERASEALAFDKAVRLYTLAVELAEACGEPMRGLRERLGFALANAGRPEEAARSFLSAAAVAPPFERLDLQRQAAEQLLASGRIAEGRAVLADVLAEVGMKLPASRGQALASYLWTRLIIRLRGRRFDRRDASAVPQDVLLRVDACSTAQLGLVLVDSVSAISFTARMVLLALRAGEPSRLARALAFEGGITGSFGGSNRKKAEELLDRSMELAREIGDTHAMALAATTRGLVRMFSGYWRDACRLWDESKQYMVLTKTGLTDYSRVTTWEFAMSLLVHLVTLTYIGEWEEVCQRVPALLEGARERGNLYAAVGLASRVLHHVCMYTDDPERFYGELDQTLAQWPDYERQVYQGWSVLSRGEIDLYTGKVKEGWKRMEAEWAKTRRSSAFRFQIIRIEMRHIRARMALAAAAAGLDASAMLSVAYDEARAIEREAAAWSDPMAVLVRAGISAARGRREEAIRQLEDAERRLQAADMPPHAAAARRRRGQLTGGDAGRVLVASADEAIAAMGACRPERIADVLVPGLWE
jgi:serine/threonine protein kinase/tetratricopeptide (TPR) repeat protein